MSQTTQKPYRIQFKFNGEVKEKRTTDVAKAIQDVRPMFLHTEMYVTLKHGKELIERRLSLLQARRIFSDEVSRQVFINNLLLSTHG